MGKKSEGKKITKLKTKMMEIFKKKKYFFSNPLLKYAEKTGRKNFEKKTN